MRRSVILCLAATALVAVASAPVAAATASTSRGEISVAQVMAMLDQAGSSKTAAQVLQAYLGGLGEATGILVSAQDATGRPFAECARPMKFDADSARKTLQQAAPDKGTWGETAATPLLVSALVNRAGCS